MKDRIANIATTFIVVVILSFATYLIVLFGIALWRVVMR